MCLKRRKNLSITNNNMQQEFVILLILFGVYLESLGKITIFCEFTDESYHESLYTCIATPGEACNGSCDEIVIEGKHEFGKTNKDVKAFVLENKNITKIPKKLASVFPNLVFINFKDNLITNVTWPDIQQFRNLKSIRLTGNKITGIYENIFEGLPLVHIEINNNNLEYIFDDLTYANSLGYLNFKNNKCIDMEARSPEAIDKLKDKMLLRCSHSPRTKHLEQIVMDIKKHDVSSDAEIESLKNVIKKLKEAMKFKFY